MTVAANGVADGRCSTIEDAGAEGAIGVGVVDEALDPVDGGDAAA